ncbi:GNAT family N-acetyltransferase [Candidatus Woesebacteria bacterium]|nr:GNAT family N-acetyltransferase [Candidatus Woesebacteria bacterium]
MSTPPIIRRPLTDDEIDLLMSDIATYPDLPFIKKSRFRTFGAPYIMMENGDFVGICGVFDVDEKWMKIGPFVLLRNFHGKGYGKQIMGQIIADSHHKNKFIMSSNIAVQKIVEKQNFHELSGFWTVPINIKMFLLRSIPDHLHLFLITEFIRKLFLMKRGRMKYYVKMV